MAVVNRPLLGRETILVVVNCKLSIEWLCDVGALSRDQEDLLVYLDEGEYAS